MAGGKHPPIDKISHEGQRHFVYYKTPQYWLISRYRTKKLMFSIPVMDLILSEEQKAEQKKLLLKRFDDRNL